MSGGLGLCARLSKLLVAWTIEFDNAFEERIQATWARPFLVSTTMWANVMRHVPEAGIELAELSAGSGIAQRSLMSIIGGLERWGYVAIDHDPAQGHPGRRKGFGTASGLNAGTVVYPSVVGALAQGIWQPLAPEVDRRWRDRDRDGVDTLEEALTSIAESAADRLPAFLPVLNSAGLFSGPVLAGDSSEPAGSLGLSTALSQVLLALTVDIERDAVISLPVSANVLRVLDDTPTPVRELPLAAGISKEAVSLTLGLLEKHGAATVESPPEGRARAAAITAAGTLLREQLAARVIEVEAEWAARFGRMFDVLTDAVDALHNDRFLRSAVAPPETSWRVQKGYVPLTTAFVERPTDALPEHPIVLHRGGWPDGS